MPQNTLVASDVPVPPKHVSASLGVNSTAANGSIVETCLLSPQGEAKVPAKDEPLPMKSVIPTDQKTLRVRIKMGSDKAPQKNAAIYCGLGLISPSSSMGHSPDASGGEALESQESPAESPASIIKVNFYLYFQIGVSLLLSGSIICFLGWFVCH